MELDKVTTIVELGTALTFTTFDKNIFYFNPTQEGKFTIKVNLQDDNNISP